MKNKSSNNFSDGFFITFEGIEGAGKSTLIEFIEKFLLEKGCRVIKTREPGGTKIGEQIREILLNNKNYIEDDAELLLMFAARAQHIKEVIFPALESKHIVLCDRFTDASYAYQGGGRGIEASRINLLEKWVQGDLTPDLTILLDLDVNVGMKRTVNRGKTDRFESEDSVFFEKIRECYLEIAEDNPQRFRIINAEKPIESVKEQAIIILKDYL
jgi:dTMP kinase